ncbi:MAG: hypothetical protein IJ736_00460 [Firmicutes bacterium]|nr:hypothetical protein [Bacillota bacterium]
MSEQLIIKEYKGIKLLKNEDKFYLEYDAGAHSIDIRRIEISEDETDMCRYADDEMYNTIIKYQNNGVYGEK